MLYGRQRRYILDGARLAAGTPYAERADRQETRLDRALLGAWGGISPYLPFERSRLDRFVRRVEMQERGLTVLPDQRLRQTADELRGRLLSARFDSEPGPRRS